MNTGCQPVLFTVQLTGTQCYKYKKWSACKNPADHKQMISWNKMFVS